MFSRRFEKERMLYCLVLIYYYYYLNILINIIKLINILNKLYKIFVVDSKRDFLILSSRRIRIHIGEQPFFDIETIIRLPFSFFYVEAGRFSEGACHPGPLSVCSEAVTSDGRRYPSRTLHKSRRGEGRRGSCLRSGRSAPVKLVSLFA